MRFGFFYGGPKDGEGIELPSDGMDEVVFPKEQALVIADRPGPTLMRRWFHLYRRRGAVTYEYAGEVLR